jgi:glycosyltransferase involved in cell wall biosynthesis
VLESLVAGGIETTFLHVLKAISAAPDGTRHKVLAFAGGLLEDAYQEVATTHVTGDRRAIEAILSRQYDVVHVLFDRCAHRLMPFLLARTQSAVVYAKGYDMGSVYRLTEGLSWSPDEAMLAACDGVTFTTPHLARGFDVPPGRVTVLRKVADVRTFAQVPPVTSSTPPHIVCVANLHPLKRLGDLIRAMPRVQKVVPDVTLRLVGAGNPSEARRLISLARELGVDPVVTLTGPSQDVAGELARCRVFALPSGSEGVPTTIIEAMAAGRPVVVTRVGHVPNIVDDGVEGFVVSPGDIEALADRLIRILTDFTLARRFSAAGRARAAAHDVSAVAADVLVALRKAAGLS